MYIATKMPKISVIMPAYNETNNVVTQAINSVLCQTYKNIELIVVLDNPQNDALKNCLKEIDETSYFSIV